MKVIWDVLAVVLGFLLFGAAIGLMFYGLAQWIAFISTINGPVEWMLGGITGLVVFLAVSWVTEWL